MRFSIRLTRSSFALLLLTISAVQVAVGTVGSMAYASGTGSCEHAFSAVSVTGKDPFAAVSSRVSWTEKSTRPGNRLEAPNGLVGVEMKERVSEANEAPEQVVRDLMDWFIERDEITERINRGYSYRLDVPAEKPRFVSHSEPDEPRKLVFTDRSGNVSLTIDAIRWIEDRLNYDMDREVKITGMRPMRFSGDGTKLMVSLSGSVRRLSYESDESTPFPKLQDGSPSDMRLGLAIIDLQSHSGAHSVESAFVLPHRRDSIVVSDDLKTVTGEIYFRFASVDLGKLREKVRELQNKYRANDRDYKDPFRLINNDNLTSLSIVSEPHSPLTFKQVAFAGKSQSGLLYREYGDHEKQVFQPFLHHLRTSASDARIVSTHRIDLQTIDPRLKSIKTYKGIRVALESGPFILLALRPDKGIKEIYVRMRIGHVDEDGALKVTNLKVFDGMRDGEEPLMTAHGDVLFLSRVFEDRQEKFSLRAGDHPTLLPLANVTEVHGVERTKDGRLNIHVTFDNDSHGDWIVSPQEQASASKSQQGAHERAARSSSKYGIKKSRTVETGPARSAPSESTPVLDLSQLSVGQKAFVITKQGAVGHSVSDVEIAFGEIKSVAKGDVQMDIGKGNETFSGTKVLQQPEYLALQNRHFNRTNDLIVHAGQSFKVLGVVPSSRYSGTLSLVLIANRESQRFLQLAEVVEINDRSKGYTISQPTR